MITIKIKTIDIEGETDLFVIDRENFDHDILIGLDMIKKFKLNQDENLNITQKINSEKFKIVEDAATNNSIPNKESKKF